VFGGLAAEGPTRIGSGSPVEIRLCGSGSPVEIRLCGSGSPVEIRLCGSGSPVEIRLFGFRPEGDTSLPVCVSLMA
jgi:hypothetical protein